MPELKLTELGISSLSTEKAQEEFYDSAFELGGSFGVRVSAGGKKVFFYIYSLAGRRRRMTLGTFPILSLSDARAKAAEVARLVETGRDPARDGNGVSGRLTELIDQFLTHRSVATLAPKTRLEYARILHREIRPRWGDRMVESITAREVNGLLLEVAEERNSPVMAARIRALLSKLFNFGIKRGVLEANPVSETHTTAISSKKHRQLSLDELREIWRAAAEEPPTIRAIFRLLLLTGQRPSEVLSMRWGDLTLDEWMPGRSIPLPLTGAMKATLEQLPRNPASPFVFAGPRTGMKRAAHGHIVSIRRAAKRIADRMKNDTESWSVLDIRRSVEAQLSEQGVRPEIIERLMGRTALLSRLPKSTNTFDYSREMRRALERYEQRLVPTPSKGRTKQEGASKVIELFPRQED